MNIIIERGDLLEHCADVIAHQCNVMSNGVSGLAAIIFKKHPEVNTYYKNPRPALYEEIELFQVEDAAYKYIANMYSQYHPGPPHNIPEGNVDSAAWRLTAFKICLDSLAEKMNSLDLNSVAFPYWYGCGLAGGNWEQYLERLFIWDEKFDFDVRIVKLSQ